MSVNEGLCGHVSYGNYKISQIEFDSVNFTKGMAMAAQQGIRRKAHFLGTKIKSLRKRNNLTLEDLSVRCVQIDPEAVVALFSEDARYYETPFLPPARGHDGVRDYWANATRKQSDVSFSYEVVSLFGDRGIARWWAEFTRVSSGTRAALDGIFLLEFDNEGLCRELREWWHITETESEDV